MRKHNEGYALVLVLVVLIVLALLATVILTSAQRNLEAHKHGIAYMDNKYQAQGEIEKILGQLEKMIIADEPENSLSNSEGNPFIEIDRDEGKVHIVSSFDTVEIDCTLLLVNGVIDLEGKLINLDGYSYISYEISTNGGGN